MMERTPGNGTVDQVNMMMFEYNHEVRLRVAIWTDYCNLLQPSKLFPQCTNSLIIH